LFGASLELAPNRFGSC